MSVSSGGRGSGGGVSGFRIKFVEGFVYIVSRAASFSRGLWMRIIS